MILCDECKYYENVGRSHDDKGECNHPNNMEVVYDFRSGQKRHLKSPQDINCKNNCGWFKKLPWWGRIL